MVFLSIKEFFLDLFFPKSCIKCGFNGSYLCLSCINFLYAFNVQICPNCKIKNYSGEFCDDECSKNYYFNKLYICSSYRKNIILKKLIILFKYRFSKELVNVLGDVLVKFLKIYLGNFHKKQYLVIPVPVIKNNYRNRGFNQSKLISEYICKYFKVLKLCDCLKRKGSNISQAKLSKKGRLSNLSNSVYLKNGFKEIIKHKSVILVDDVYTTGTTINQCSKVLKNEGVEYICGLVLAHG